MKASVKKGAARTGGGLLALPARAAAHISLCIAVAKAWQWGPLMGRVALAGLGLVLLGAIGRSALAKNLLATEPGTSVGVAIDAGLSPHTGKGLDPLPGVAAPSPAAPPSASLPPLTLATEPAATGAGGGAGAGAGGGAAPARAHATPDDPVYLNQATAADLHRLPGVGPKRADAILALRTKLGHFRQIEDLLKVKGIGRSSLKKLRPLVRLDPPPAALGGAEPGDAGR